MPDSLKIKIETKDSVKEIQNLNVTVNKFGADLKGIESKLDGFNSGMTSSINIQKQISKTLTDISNSMRSLNSGLATVNKNYQQLNQSYVQTNNSLKINANLQQNNISLTKQATNVVNNYNNSVKDSSKQINNASTANKKLHSSFSAIKTLLPIIGFGLLAKELYDTALATDRIAKGLAAATGSMIKGSQASAFLMQESNRLGVVYEKQITAYQQLAAAARGTSLESKATKDIFLAVAEASVALQLRSDQVSKALYAMQQMISKGNVQSEELRRQLGEQLPGAFQLAAQSMNTTTKGLNKMLKAGTVIAEDFLPKFARALRKHYAGTLEESTQALQSHVARAKNSWFELKSVLTEGTFTEVLITGFKDISSVLNAFADAIKNNKKDIEGFFKTFQDGYNSLKIITKGMKDLLEDRSTSISDYAEVVKKALDPVIKLYDKVQNIRKANIGLPVKLFGDYSNLKEEKEKLKELMEDPDVYLRFDIKDLRDQLEELSKIDTTKLTMSNVDLETGEIDKKWIKAYNDEVKSLTTQIEKAGKALIQYSVVSRKIDEDQKLNKNVTALYQDKILRWVSDQNAVKAQAKIQDKLLIERKKWLEKYEPLSKELYSIKLDDLDSEIKKQVEAIGLSETEAVRLKHIVQVSLYEKFNAKEIQEIKNHQELLRRMAEDEYQWGLDLAEQEEEANVKSQKNILDTYKKGIEDLTITKEEFAKKTAEVLSILTDLNADELSMREFYDTKREVLNKRTLQQEKDRLKAFKKLQKSMKQIGNDMDDAKESVEQGFITSEKAMYGVDVSLIPLTDQEFEMGLDIVSKYEDDYNEVKQISEDTLYTLIDDWDKGFESIGDNLVNTFKKSFAKIANEKLIMPVIDYVMNGASSAVGNMVNNGTSGGSGAGAISSGASTAINAKASGAGIGGSFAGGVASLAIGYSIQNYMSHKSARDAVQQAIDDLVDSFNAGSEAIKKSIVSIERQLSDSYQEHPWSEEIISIRQTHEDRIANLRGSIPNYEELSQSVTTSVSKLDEDKIWAAYVKQKDLSEKEMNDRLALVEKQVREQLEAMIPVESAFVLSIKNITTTFEEMQLAIDDITNELYGTIAETFREKSDIFARKYDISESSMTLENLTALKELVVNSAIKYDSTQQDALNTNPLPTYNFSGLRDPNTPAPWYWDEFDKESSQRQNDFWTNFDLEMAAITAKFTDLSKVTQEDIDIIKGEIAETGKFDLGNLESLSPLLQEAAKDTDGFIKSLEELIEQRRVELKLISDYHIALGQVITGLDISKVGSLLSESATGGGIRAFTKSLYDSSMTGIMNGLTDAFSAGLSKAFINPINESIGEMFSEIDLGSESFGTDVVKASKAMADIFEISTVKMTTLMDAMDTEEFKQAYANYQRLQNEYLEQPEQLKKSLFGHIDSNAISGWLADAVNEASSNTNYKQLSDGFFKNIVDSFAESIVNSQINKVSEAFQNYLIDPLKEDIVKKILAGEDTSGVEDQLDALGDGKGLQNLIKIWSDMGRKLSDPNLRLSDKDSADLKKSLKNVADTLNISTEELIGVLNGKVKDEVGKVDPDLSILTANVNTGIEDEVEKIDPDFTKAKDIVQYNVEEQINSISPDFTIAGNIVSEAIVSAITIAANALDLDITKFKPSTKSSGGYSKGLWQVPTNEMMALIHKDEIVVPAKYSDSVRSYLKGSGRSFYSGTGNYSIESSVGSDAEFLSALYLINSTLSASGKQVLASNNNIFTQTQKNGTADQRFYANYASRSLNNFGSDTEATTAFFGGMGDIGILGNLVQGLIDSNTELINSTKEATTTYDETIKGIKADLSPALITLAEATNKFDEVFPPGFFKGTISEVEGKYGLDIGKQLREILSRGSDMSFQDIVRPAGDKYAGMTFPITEMEKVVQILMKELTDSAIEGFRIQGNEIWTNILESTGQSDDVELQIAKIKEKYKDWSDSLKDINQLTDDRIAKLEEWKQAELNAINGLEKITEQMKSFMDVIFSVLSMTGELVSLDKTIWDIQVQFDEFEKTLREIGKASPENLKLLNEKELLAIEKATKESETAYQTFALTIGESVGLFESSEFALYNLGIQFDEYRKQLVAFGGEDLPELLKSLDEAEELAKQQFKINRNTPFKQGAEQALGLDKSSLEEVKDFFSSIGIPKEDQTIDFFENVIEFYNDMDHLNELTDEQRDSFSKLTDAFIEIKQTGDDAASSVYDLYRSIQDSLVDGIKNISNSINDTIIQSLAKQKNTSGLGIFRQREEIGSDILIFDLTPFIGNVDKMQQNVDLIIQWGNDALASVKDKIDRWLDIDNKAKNLIEKAGSIGDVEDSLDVIPRMMTESLEGVEKYIEDTTTWLDKASSLRDQLDSFQKTISKQKSGISKDILKKETGSEKGYLEFAIARGFGSINEDVSIEEKLSRAEELNDLIMDRYDLEKQEIENAIQAIENFGDQVDLINDKILSLKYSDLNVLPQEETLVSAKEDYANLLAAAQGGTSEDLNDYLNFVNTYLQEAQDLYKSSTQYQDIWNQVNEDIESLGTDTSEAKTSQEFYLSELNIAAVKANTALDNISNNVENWETELTNAIGIQTINLSGLFEKIESGILGEVKELETIKEYVDSVYELVKKVDVEKINDIMKLAEDANKNAMETLLKANDAIIKSAEEANINAMEAALEANNAIIKSAEEANKKITESAKEANINAMETALEANNAIIKSAEEANKKITESSDYANKNAMETLLETNNAIIKSAEEANKKITESSGYANKNAMETALEANNALIKSAEEANKKITESSDYANINAMEAALKANNAIIKLAEEANKKITESSDSANINAMETLLEANNVIIKSAEEANKKITESSDSVNKNVMETLLEANNAVIKLAEEANKKITDSSDSVNKNAMETALKANNAIIKSAEEANKKIIDSSDYANINAMEAALKANDAIIKSVENVANTVIGSLNKIGEDALKTINDASVSVITATKNNQPIINITTDNTGGANVTATGYDPQIFAQGMLTSQQPSIDYASTPIMPAYNPQVFSQGMLTSQQYSGVSTSSSIMPDKGINTNDVNKTVDTLIGVLVANPNIDYGNWLNNVKTNVESLGITSSVELAKYYDGDYGTISQTDMVNMFAETDDFAGFADGGISTQPTLASAVGVAPAMYTPQETQQVTADMSALRASILASTFDDLLASGLMGDELLFKARDAAINLEYSNSYQAGVAYIAGKGSYMDVTPEMMQQLFAPTQGFPGFADGGISTQPTLAMVSEGRFNTEAHIPMPDGRTVPVTITNQNQDAGTDMTITNQLLESILARQDIKVYVGNKELTSFVRYEADSVRVEADNFGKPGVRLY